MAKLNIGLAVLNLFLGLVYSSVYHLGVAAFCSVAALIVIFSKG